MWWFVLVVSIASIPLAETMAQGAAKVVDPRDAEHPARANQETPKNQKEAEA
jgi:hypothetical protein